MAEKNGTINESVIEKVYGTSAGIDFNSPPQQRILQLVSDVQCFSRYKIDDYEVELTWSDSPQTLQESIRNIFARS